MNRRTLIGYGLMVVTAIGWAGAWITARHAAHDVGALTVAVGRFVVAAAALLPVWWFMEGRHNSREPLSQRERGLLMAMALTGAIGYNVLFLFGVERAPASDGAIITPGLAGPAALLWAWLLHGQRPSNRAVQGATIAFAGLLLVGWSGFTAAGGDPVMRLTGNGLFVAAALIWGLYTILGRELAGRVSAVQSILVTTAAGAVMLAPIAWLVDGAPDVAAWTSAALFNILYLGVGATAVAFVTFYAAVRMVGIERTGPALGLVPAFGVVGAALFLGEPLSFLHAAGGALVIAGILTTARRAKKR